jgi:hypothetical protein
MRGGIVTIGGGGPCVTTTAGRFFLRLRVLRLIALPMPSTTRATGTAMTNSSAKSSNASSPSESSVPCTRRSGA